MKISIISENKINYLALFQGMVWISFGLWGKILGTRHELIMQRILGTYYPSDVVIYLGIFEILFGLWLALGTPRRATTYVQIAAILSMNSIEYIYAADLLMFGHSNILVAVLYCMILYYSDKHTKHSKLQAS